MNELNPEFIHLNPMKKAESERYLWGYLYLLLVAIVVIALDQGMKLLVRANLNVGGTWTPWEWLSDYAVIVHTWNTGMTLGFLKGTNGLFIALSEIICISILLLFPTIIRKRNTLTIGLGLGLILGGAAGNLIDRVFIGYVTDIFLVTYLPVFNLADLSVLFGAFILSFGLIFDNQEGEQSENE